MTEFGFYLLEWAKGLEGSEDRPFDEDMVMKQFTQICKRKARATLMGCVVAGYLKMTVDEQGNRLYCICENEV